MAYTSLAAALLRAFDQHPSLRAQMYRSADRWEAVSSQELLRRIAGLANCLVELGVKSGDRVGLFAPNCPEWHTADFAINGSGAVTVPIYFNESPDRMTYILNHCGAQVVFIAGLSQLEKFLQIRRQLAPDSSTSSLPAPALSSPKNSFATRPSSPLPAPRKSPLTACALLTSFPLNSHPSFTLPAPLASPKASCSRTPTSPPTSPIPARTSFFIPKATSPFRFSRSPTSTAACWITLPLSGHPHRLRPQSSKTSRKPSLEVKSHRRRCRSAFLRKNLCPHDGAGK